jgi:hypothetical protein
MPTINGRACVVNGKPVDKVYSNGKQVYGRNLFSVRDWNAKPYLISNSVPYMNIQLEPNTEYTLTTNIRKTNEYFDVFFFKDNEDASSSINGVNSGSGRTLTTSSTGNVKVGMRNYFLSLSDDTNWIKLEKGSVATPWTPAPEDVGAVVQSA